MTGTPIFDFHDKLINHEKRELTGIGAAPIHNPIIPTAIVAKERTIEKNYDNKREWRSVDSLLHPQNRTLLRNPIIFFSMYRMIRL